MENSYNCDVLIAGGGLAGLGLAYQIRKQKPDADIIVLEKQHFPRPKAIAKVGESTVEIGSHYLAKELDLESHLEEDHLRKFGLRMFFGDADMDFTSLDELGSSQSFDIPTYQIDRGDLENTMEQRLRAMGVKIIEGANILECDIGNKAHTVSFELEDRRASVSCRWVIDAAGRRSLIKNALNLTENSGHRSNAIWFRVDTRIEIDGWSDNESWRKKCQPEGRRWLSTNHLTGAGYWVWIIPLASNITSIGIVMDDEAFSSAAISDESTARSWLEKNHPLCAQAMSAANFLDFVVLPDYSYGCKQVFSQQGWALTGEAGYFADPFYSPGTDFIAIANTLITELVTEDLNGANVGFTSALYEKVFASIYENTLSVYVGQYGGFGDRKMMGLKLLWDYSYYWGVLAFLYIGKAFSDLQQLRKLSPMLLEAQALNQDMQALFRDRAKKRMVLPKQGLFMDQHQIPCLKQFNSGLINLSPELLESELANNMVTIRVIASSVKDMMSDSSTKEMSDKEREFLGEYRELILS